MAKVGEEIHRFRTALEEISLLGPLNNAPEIATLALRSPDKESAP